jgi:hypothetical protein
MIRPEDIRAVLQNVAGWIASLALTVVVLAIWPALASGQRYVFPFSWTIAQGLVAGALLIVLLFMSGRSLYRAMPTTIVGREAIMRRNVDMVRRLGTSKDDEFLSTRVTYWDLGEQSPSRVAFRSLITEKINAGFLVKRLWHLSSLDDVERLRGYLGTYRGYDNYHVRVLAGMRVPVPELIAIGRKGASITFPELASPRRVGLSIQFRGRDEALAIHKYFDLLWDLAEPIKTGAEINYARLDVIRKDIQGGD